MANKIRSLIPTTRPARRWRLPALLAAALGLVVSYLLVRIKTRQAEHENTPAGQFIEVDGVRLHYVERGAGPPLVLLHGNGILANDFDTSGLLDRAAEHYRVIVFDRPGYGHSERPRSTVWTPQAQARLLHKALRHLGAGRATVMGHSWGTLVALAMALEFPDEVHGLVLVSGHYYPSLRLHAQRAVPLLGDLARYTVAPLLGKLLWPLLVRRTFGPPEVPARLKRLPVWMLLRPSQLHASAAESALMIPSAAALRKRYPELRMPVAIIAGQDDRLASAEHNVGRLNRELASSDLYIEAGVGHMVHHTRPVEVMAAIDSVRSPPARWPDAHELGLRAHL